MTGKAEVLINFNNMSYFIPLLASGILLLYLAAGRVRYIKRKIRFKVIKDKKSVLTKLTERLSEQEVAFKLLNNLAVKISMFTAYSHSKNMEIACLCIMILSGTMVIALTVILAGAAIAWYMSLAYFIIILLFVLIIFYVFARIARMRFTSKLPAAFKLLNSRYISKGNILKAISVSLEDMDGTVRREMIKIYDVLKKNDMAEIDDTFKMIEATYENEYLTLLLALIRHAHYKGGNEVLKQQFEQATEEVLLDIENQKDLSATARAYIFLALTTPPLILGIERFNKSALGDNAVEFYKSSNGLEMLMLLLVTLLAFIGYMLFLERTA